jgi:hypothetical protein
VARAYVLPVLRLPTDLPTGRPRSRPRSPFPRPAAVLLLLALAGCSRSGGGADDVVHVAGADQKVKLDPGPGPLDELVLVRDTAGRFVLSGLCFFPDGTRVDVALYDSTGRFRARTQPTVERAMLRALPLGDEAGRGWPAGRYAIELSANFAPGAQAPEVLRAVGSGGQFGGAGMTRSRQGHPAYSRRFQVRL